jgi:hypothetical protein
MITTTSTVTRPPRLAVVGATLAALGATVLSASTATAEAAPSPGLSCLPIVCGADYLGLPVEDLLTELDEDALASGGAPIDVLVARIDAAADVRLALAGRTDGPMQVAAMRFLRDEHDRVRFAVIVGATGDSPPVFLPS